MNNRVNELCKLIVSEHDPSRINVLLQELNTALKDAALDAENKLVALSWPPPSSKVQ